MGSGETFVKGTFRPEKTSPDFDLNVRIVKTRMKSLNELLRAYGKFDVSEGKFSLYSELTVKNGGISGYVKPLFKDVDVYDPEQDRDKGLLTKMYERLIGGLTDVLKNEPREEVATQAEVSGPIKNPRANTWEMVVKLIQNAFFEAILPGFEEQARTG